MALSKRRKIFLALLAVCVAGLIYDRLQPGPHAVGPTAAAGSMIPDAYTAELEDGLSAAAGAASPTQPHNTLANRLEGLAKAQGLDGMDVRDAFRPPEEWMGRTAAEQPAPGPKEDNARRLVENRRLRAILVGPDGSSAIIDNRCLRIGQKLDGFELVSIDKRSVVLACNGVRVTLQLAAGASGGEDN